MNSLERPKGTLAAGGILDRIVLAKASRLARTRQDHLPRFANNAPRTTGFSFTRQLAEAGQTNILAEIKHRSPSKGVIREDFEPIAIAESYEAAGAAGLSVLTEEDFFGGSLDHLRMVRKHVKLPLLRKDFIFNEYQMYESADAGADAVLLIVAILDDELLASLIGLSRELGIDALVEVHTEAELERAVRAGARLVGVNNRDLTTFVVDLKTSANLASAAPAHVYLVSESGIRSGEQIVSLKRLGYRGFLIGEHFMRSRDPGQELRSLLFQVQAATA